MNHLDTAADHLSAAAAALRIAVGESDSALASLSILRALEKTMRAFNEASSLRDARKADDASTASPAR